MSFGISDVLTCFTEDVWVLQSMPLHHFLKWHLHHLFTVQISKRASLLALLWYTAGLESDDEIGRVPRLDLQPGSSSTSAKIGPKHATPTVRGSVL